MPIDDAGAVGVPICTADILWEITPIMKEEDGGTIIELHWGWTVGMSQEEIDEFPDDCPTGSSSVKTSLKGARALRDKLNDLLGDQ